MQIEIKGTVVVQAKLGPFPVSLWQFQGQQQVAVNLISHFLTSIFRLHY